MKKQCYLSGIIISLGLLSCVPVGGTGSSGNSTPTVSPSPTTSPTPANSWTYVGGIPGISESEADYVSLAINRQTGAMAVGFQDQAASGKLSVLGMPLNGSSWSYLGGQGITFGIANYISVAYSPNGSLFAGFQDLSTTGITPPGQGKANVYQYNNTTWQWYTDESGSVSYASDGVAANIAMAVPQNNRPYLTYSYDVSKYLGVSYHTDLGWVRRTFEPITATFNQIAFVPDIPNSDMFIAVKDAEYYNSVSVFYSPESYTSLSVVGSRGFTYNHVYYVSLAVSHDSIPYVAFEDAANNDKLTVMYYNGAGWVYVGGAPGISAGKAVYVSMALDLNDNPYVAYQDLSTGMNGKIVVQRFINNKWSTIGQGFSVGQANYISLKINPLTNLPAVAFQDVGLGSLLSVMKYTGQ